MSEISHSVENQRGDEKGHCSSEHDSGSSCAHVEDMLAQERCLSAELKLKIKALEEVVLAQRLQLEEENAHLREEMVRLADLIVKKACS